MPEATLTYKEIVRQLDVIPRPCISDLIIRLVEIGHHRGVFANYGASAMVRNAEKRLASTKVVDPRQTSLPFMEEETLP